MSLILEYGNKFLSSFILMSATIYIWHKLLNMIFDFKNTKIIITILGLSVISIVNYYIINPYIKILSITIILIIFFKFLFKENIQKCIIVPIISQLIVMISETIFALLITIFLNSDEQLILNSLLGSFLANIIISIFSIVIIQFKFFASVYYKILVFTDRIKKSKLLLLGIVIIVALSIFPITIYYKIKFQYLLIFYSLMIIACCLIVFSFFNAHSKYIRVNDKYNIAIKSLKDYENMMTRYRIASHENKNLLLTIRAMILNQEKDIPKYIDSILENKYKDDENLLFKTSVIPSGGLRATIYSEVLKIKENNIKYSLNIEKDLSTIDLIELDEKTIIDVCKIIGVLIDNAIDEVKKIRSKNINIELFVMNDSLNIKIANQFKNIIEISKIFDEGYTTKGKNHGYGLSLVKKIVNDNKMFKIKTEVNNRLFIQTLIVKFKAK